MESTQDAPAPAEVTATEDDAEILMPRHLPPGWGQPEGQMAEPDEPAQAEPESAQPDQFDAATNEGEVEILMPGHLPPGWGQPPAETAEAEEPAEIPSTETSAVEARAETGASSPPAPTIETIPAALLEDFATPPGQGGRRVGQGVILLLLIGLLFGQWVYAQRAVLYRLPAWQPFLDRVCGLVACDLPWRRAPQYLEIEHKDVRAHPQVDGALLINATLVNKAPFTQAYPMVGLFFSDLSGHQRAGRWFPPRAYLEPGVDPAGGVKPGQRFAVRLEIVDPGMKLVSYQFDFR